ARDPNRRTVQLGTEFRAAPARERKARIDTCLSSVGNHPASLLRANAADRQTIRREAAPRPEMYELAAAVVRTLELKPVAYASNERDLTNLVATGLWPVCIGR